MDRIKIVGGNKLNGIIPISGAKNAALPLMIASLLTDDTLTLENVPHLADVEQLIRILSNHGVDYSVNGRREHQDGAYSRTIHFTARNIVTTTAPYELVSKMRASFWVIAPLLARMGEANVSLPGGCAIACVLGGIVVVYAFGVLVQMPFISTKLYTGPMVERLGGVDISWIIGLVVPAVLYYLFARRDARPDPPRQGRAMEIIGRGFLARSLGPVAHRHHGTMTPTSRVPVAARAPARLPAMPLHRPRVRRLRRLGRRARRDTHQSPEADPA